MAVVKIRPGYLISLKTSIQGGPRYTHNPLESSAASSDGPEIEKFITTKTTEDPEEYKRAVKLRGKARGLVESVLIPSDFGLLCLKAKKERYDEALKEAKEYIEFFNNTSRTCHIAIRSIAGEIVESDTEANQSIVGELRDLLTTVQNGVTEMDVKKIRAAADKLKDVGAMLDEDNQRKVVGAVKEAREVANQIAKMARKKATDIGDYVQTIKLKAVDEARFTFLDMDGPAEVSGDALPMAPGRVLDIEPEAKVEASDDNADDASNDMKMVAASGDVRKLDL
jgi:hypothetical protein